MFKVGDKVIYINPGYPEFGTICTVHTVNADSLIVKFNNEIKCYNFVDGICHFKLLYNTDKKEVWNKPCV